MFNDTELFTSGALRVRKFDIPDAELTLYEHFFNREESDRFYKVLLEETPWKQEPITIHGQTHLMPRLTAWYGKRWSGKPPTPLTPTLATIQERVEAEARVKFTSVLLNLYRTGQDSVSWHRDHEREFGKNPIVGSVSFGETRPFRIRHKFRKDLGTIEIPLNHGSFLLMAGPMQHYWEHQIPKTSKDIKPRINLTFRIVHDIISGYVY
ncbi:MAG TPA: alpha-ketoglutarate-dependent dioxygenase AlkB [Chitinophagaceae bacterium]|nr:alpha-ketoglutarate-dependent dioxygenase AlkB [Chitinophagaceae bacterium]